MSLLGRWCLPKKMWSFSLDSMRGKLCHCIRDTETRLFSLSLSLKRDGNSLFITDTKKSNKSKYSCFQSFCSNVALPSVLYCTLYWDKYWHKQAKAHSCFFVNVWTSARICGCVRLWIWDRWATMASDRKRWTASCIMLVIAEMVSFKLGEVLQPILTEESLVVMIREDGIHQWVWRCASNQTGNYTGAHMQTNPYRKSKVNPLMGRMWLVVNSGDLVATPSMTW